MDSDQKQKHERGIAVLFVALFLLVSLWFVSMAIDVGKVMAARTEAGFGDGPPSIEYLDVHNVIQR